MLYTREYIRKITHKTGMARPATDELMDTNGVWAHMKSTVRRIVRDYICERRARATNWKFTSQATQIKRFWLVDEFNNILWWIKMQQLINCTYLILLIGASAATATAFCHNVLRVAFDAVWSRFHGVAMTSELHMYFASILQRKTTNDKRKASISGIWIIWLPHART